MVRNDTLMGMFTQSFASSGTLSPEPLPIPGMSMRMFRIEQATPSPITGEIVFTNCHFRWKIVKSDSGSFDISATSDRPERCHAKGAVNPDNGLPQVVFTEE